LRFLQKKHAFYGETAKKFSDFSVPDFFVFFSKFRKKPFCIFDFWQVWQIDSAVLYIFLSNLDVYFAGKDFPPHRDPLIDRRTPTHQKGSNE
jgi:hypothetical protein